jgi:hypothetical protein
MRERLEKDPAFRSRVRLQKKRGKSGVFSDWPFSLQESEETVAKRQAEADKGAARGRGQEDRR